MKVAKRLLLLLVALCLVAPMTVSAQTSIDLERLIAETQRMSEVPDRITLVWWIPEAYWQAAFDRDPTITRADADAFLEMMRPYHLFAVVDGTIGMLGNAKFTPPDEVGRTIRLETPNGRRFAPLMPDALDQGATIVMSLFKPIIASMIGPMGDNMFLAVFPAYDHEGEPLLDLLSKGSFTLTVADQQFRFNLPLVSILPPKYDPVTGEQFPGNYIYSPFTGNLLVADPAEI